MMELGGQESLNISIRNIRAQMPRETRLVVFSYTLSSFPFFAHCKDRICYHVHFHLDPRKYQEQKSELCD